MGSWQTACKWWIGCILRSWVSQGFAVLLVCGIVQSARAEVLHLEDLIPNLQTDETEYLLCGIHSLTGWVYQSGDDLSWSSPFFNDENWLRLSPPTDDTWHQPNDIDWRGVGWFRLHLKLGDDLIGRDLAFLLYQVGAIEIYINGKLVFNDGRIKDGELFEAGQPVFADVPRVVPLAPFRQADVVIAVRYANADAENRTTLGLPTWWGLALSTFQDAYMQRDQRIRQYSLLQMLAWVPMAFALLHLLLFLFYRRARNNLYYAILAGITSVLIFVPMYFSFKPEHIEVLLYITKMAFLGATLASLKFYYYEFFNRMPRYWPYIFWPGIVLCLFSWKIPLQAVFVIAFLSFPELIRIVFKAVCQHKPGAWFIGLGLLAFLITGAYQGLIELNIIARNGYYLYIYGILGLVVSMSVYLAYNFGAARKQLEHQVVQIQQLSEQNIKQSQYAREQELEKRERETARKVLEAKNRLHTMELEEAQKRQQILDDLAQSNRDLNQTQAQLVQAEKMASLGNLVAGIAHEINTPVGAINSMHDTLVRAVAKLETEINKKLPEDHAAQKVVSASFQVIGEANRVIATGTERVREIVRSLRNFARLDEAEWKRVDLHEGIESTLALVQHNIKNRIELIKNYGPIPLVECFPGRLNQVFLNLLVNAAQAIENKGQITIATRQEGDRVLVDIVDTGKGISPENLERIFESGFTTKKVGMGTGLGLSICAQIMQAHQGEIYVESEVGAGTTFTVSLPVVQPSNKKEEVL